MGWASLLYVVEGLQVGFGNMGEPVLSDARIVGEVPPGEVRTLPDSARMREVLELWRARLRGDDTPYTALRLFSGPDPEERPLFPPMVPRGSVSFSERVNVLLESWGHKDIADERRQEQERAEERRRERQRERPQKRTDEAAQRSYPEWLGAGMVEPSPSGWEREYRKREEELRRFEKQYGLERSWGNLWT